MDGLRKYERVSEEQQAEACNVLAKCVPAGKENVTPHVTQQSMQMTFPSYYHYQQHQQPGVSFAGAVLNNCVINVCKPQEKDD